MAKTAIEHAGVKENQSHVAAGFGRDVSGIDVGAGSKEIDGADDVVGAETDEGAPNQIGAQTEQIERPKQRSFHVVGAGRRWARREGEDDVALSGERIEFGLIGARDRVRPMNRVWERA